jgi:hypothetical protein
MTSTTRWLPPTQPLPAENVALVRLGPKAFDALCDVLVDDTLLRGSTRLVIDFLTVDDIKRERHLPPMARSGDTERLFERFEVSQPYLEIVSDPAATELLA